MKRSPLAGWSRRFWSFLCERHPLPSRLVLSLLVYMGPAAFTAHLHGIQASLWAPTTAIGTVSVFNFYLILRLSDELKDIDLDAVRFPDRPLPSGRVKPGDLHIALIAAAVLSLVLNAGTNGGFFAAAAVLAYQLLMFKFFFMRDILRGRPLMNLATHNPVFAFLPLYAVFAFAGEYRIPPMRLDWAAIVPFIVMLWLPFLAWEIARKLRVPERHDPYDIYSPALGHAGAVVTVTAAQGAALLLALWVAHSQSLTWVYGAIVAGGFAVAVAGNIRFLLAPSETSTLLRPVAEIFVASVLAAQLVGFAPAVL